MNTETTMRERFKEKFPNPIYDEYVIGSPEITKEIEDFIKSEIDRAVAKEREEMEWGIGEYFKNKDYLPERGQLYKDLITSIKNRSV